MKKEWSKSEINFVLREYKKGFSRFEICRKFLKKFTYPRSPNSIKHCIETYGADVEKDLPRVLILDVETKPRKAYIWGPRTEYVGKDMMFEDGAILSWSAKWLGEKEIFYADQRGKERNLLNDKSLMKKLAKLMNQASIILWQNGDSFDYGEINARFAEHNIELPSHYEKIDTKKIAKRHLRLPYYSLSYMTEKFNTKYKKQSHKQFPGFSMWEECMRGNLKAWDCMKTYNEFDVLSLEELFVNTLAKFAKGDAKVAAAMRTYNKNCNKK